MASDNTSSDIPAGAAPSATGSQPLPESSTATADPGKRNDRHRGKKRKHTSRDHEGQGRFQKKRRDRDDYTSNAKPKDAAKDGADSTFQSRMSIPFSAEEIAAEERQPKKKVAMMIGYAGTGYHGMQINHEEKTIEGDIFAALVKAGAISKANADDPKKSAFIRCARTDKGVHAAGNVMSMKMILGEDGKVVERINEHLPEQIRVWGIVQTNRPFNCYHACDSRWYEFLLPTYTLLPPHPESHMGKQMVELSKADGTYEERMERLDDVRTFWEDLEKNEVEPLMDSFDPAIRDAVRSRLHSAAAQEEATQRRDNIERKREPKPSSNAEEKDLNKGETSSEVVASGVTAAEVTAEASISDEPNKHETGEARDRQPNPMSPTEEAVRKIKDIYAAAHRRYRVTPARLQRLQDALDKYNGTHNFHNYTVFKSFKEPSAQRHIKSFILNPKPIQIRDTEWVSLKVHGQSFMMHQIRKMVAMATLIARCGAPLDLIAQSYTAKRISIPKAPGLGLLLERPVFDSYNAKAVSSYDKEPIDFGKYEDKMQEFKDEEIYARMFDVEEADKTFYHFYHQVDYYRQDHFLWAAGADLNTLVERSGPGEKNALEEVEGEAETGKPGQEDEG